MILYYTHNKKPLGFMKRCYDYHRQQAQAVGQEFVAVVAERFSVDDHVYAFDPQYPKYADIYLRILTGLNGVPDEEPVFLCEDDTLYPDERYSRSFPCLQTVYYNIHLCYLSVNGYAWYMQNGIALSQLMGSASAVRYNIGLKLEATLAGDMACIEPCRGQERDYQSATTRFAIPSVDFRTNYNASWKIPDDLEFFDSLEGWPNGEDLWNKLYEGKR